MGENTILKRINKANTWLFEKTNKIAKSLARLAKEKDKAFINNVRNRKDKAFINNVRNSSRRDLKHYVIILCTTLCQ